MGLSAAQMAQMSRLLDEALDLDLQGRRRWLEALAPEYRAFGVGGLVPTSLQDAKGRMLRVALRYRFL